jgi:membrane associated rhomboid family serine protease
LQLIRVLDGRGAVDVTPTKIVATAAVAFALPALAAAEVSDKILSVATMWEYALLGTTIACLAGWIHPRLLWIGLPLAAFTVAAGLETVLDAHVGPAALREQGLAYGVHAFASAGAVLVGAVIGVVLHRRRREASSGAIRRT